MGSSPLIIIFISANKVVNEISSAKNGYCRTIPSGGGYSCDLTDPDNCKSQGGTFYPTMDQCTNAPQPPQPKPGPLTGCCAAGWIGDGANCQLKQVSSKQECNDFYKQIYNEVYKNLAPPGIPWNYFPNTKCDCNLNAGNPGFCMLSTGHPISATKADCEKTKGFLQWAPMSAGIAYPPVS